MLSHAMNKLYNFQKNSIEYCVQPMYFLTLNITFRLLVHFWSKIQMLVNTPKYQVLILQKDFPTSQMRSDKRRMSKQIVLLDIFNIHSLIFLLLKNEKLAYISSKTRSFNAKGSLSKHKGLRGQDSYLEIHLKGISSYKIHQKIENRNI